MCCVGNEVCMYVCVCILASGRIGVPQTGAYCASKFAIEGITQCLAGDLLDHPHKSQPVSSPSRVTVVCLSPGAVNTPMSKALFPENMLQRAMNPREWSERTVPFIESLEFETFHGKSLGSPCERESILRLFPDAENLFDINAVLAGDGRRVRLKRPSPLVLDAK